MTVTRNIAFHAATDRPTDRVYDKLLEMHAIKTNKYWYAQCIIGSLPQACHFWISKTWDWSHIATHLVLLGATLFKKAWASVISNWMWMNYATEKMTDRVGLSISRQNILLLFLFLLYNGE